MIDASSAIDGIYSVAKLIYDQVKLVKANKQQCTRLAERVRIVESTVQGLSKITDKKQYQRALNDLLDGLKKCLAFIKQFSEAGRFYRWVLKAGTYKEEFEDLNTELQRSIAQLSLGGIAQQLINREQDKKDHERDMQFLNQNQQMIIQLNQQELQAIQQVNLQQQEQQQVMVLQLAAIRAQMTRLVQNPAANKPINLNTISYFDLMFERKVAEGAYGKVYQGRWDDQPVAIKVFEGKLTEQEEELFTREVGIMKGLRHPQIVSFYGSSCIEGRACIVMEYMDQGPLSRLVSQKLTPEYQKSLALDIAKGLQYLHKQNILHRDLKSANILINQGVAKIADFGLSKSQSISIQTTHERSQALQYQAPECFVRQGAYVQASDIYSYGVLLWEIMTGKTPSLARDVSRYAVVGEREVIPSSVPQPIAALIKACWSVNPQNRPSAAEIIQGLEAYQPRSLSPTPEECYQRGQESESKKDFKSAFESYQASLRKGHVKANTNMGLFFLKGTAVPQDKKKAHDYFRAGAEGGHPRAMFNLASMLEYGDGVPKNVSEAFKWYQKVVKQGDAKLAAEAKKKCDKLQPLLADSGPQYMDAAMSVGFKK